MPSIWLMQERTNFIQDEVMTLEEVGFFIFKKSNSHSRNLFGEDASNFVNRSVDENSWPRVEMGKIFVILQFSRFQLNNITSGRPNMFVLL
jgi:hypothetical protein